MMYVCNKLNNRLEEHKRPIHHTSTVWHIHFIHMHVQDSTDNTVMGDAYGVVGSWTLVNSQLLVY